MRSVRTRDLQVAARGFHAHRIAIQSLDPPKQAGGVLEAEICGRAAGIPQQAIDHHPCTFARHR